MRALQCSVLFSLFVAASMGRQRAKVIVLSVGGLALDLLDSTPQIQTQLKLLASAQYLMPVMPTKGPVNHWSIATGLYANDHLVLDDCEYDEPAGRCDYGLPDATLTPIWKENEEQGGISAVMNWPGAVYEYLNKKRSTYFDNHQYDLGRDRKQQINERITMIMDWITRKRNPANLVMVYYNELDKVLHRYGARSTRGQAELLYAQYFVQNLIVEVKKRSAKDVNLIVLGSHGGKTVDQKDGIRINEILKNEFAYSFVAMGANAMVIPDDYRTVDDVCTFLEKQARTTEGELRYRVYRHKNLLDAWHLGDMTLFEQKIFLVANNGHFFWNEYLDSIKNEHQPEKFTTVDGYWKYPENDNSVQTFFMAVGPNFVSGKQVPAFSTIDVYPLLRRLLKLHENENEKLSSAVQELLLKEEEPGLLDSIVFFMRSMKGKIKRIPLI